MRVAAPASRVKASSVVAARPGPQAVAEQPGEPQHRIALAGGAQEELVGDPLVVEGEHVADGREQLQDA